MLVADSKLSYSVAFFNLFQNNLTTGLFSRALPSKECRTVRICESGRGSVYKQLLHTILGVLSSFGSLILDSE